MPHYPTAYPRTVRKVLATRPPVEFNWSPRRTLHAGPPPVIGWDDYGAECVCEDCRSYGCDPNCRNPNCY